MLQVACVAQIKAVFWSKGVENIFVENPETHFQVLESMEGYWIGNLTFKEPDTNKYPCMELAYSAGRSGGTMPAVLNAANEKAVELFLEEKFKFIDIPKVIEAICEKHKCDLNLNPSLSEILEVDSWAREEVLDYSEKNITKMQF